MATVGGFVLVISYLVFHSQKAKSTLGYEGLLGQVGEVRGTLCPAGKVFVHGEYWNARADREVPVGEKVKVVGVDGMWLKVRPVNPGEQGG